MKSLSLITLCFFTSLLLIGCGNDSHSHHNHSHEKGHNHDHEGHEHHNHEKSHKHNKATNLGSITINSYSFSISSHQDIKPTSKELDLTISPKTGIAPGAIRIWLGTENPFKVKLNINKDKVYHGHLEIPEKHDGKFWIEVIDRDGHKQSDHLLIPNLN